MPTKSVWVSPNNATGRRTDYNGGSGLTKVMDSRFMMRRVFKKVNENNLIFLASFTAAVPATYIAMILHTDNHHGPPW